MKLTLLVGPIASGKSTYIKKVSNKDTVIVNDDVITSALHGGIYSDYNKNLKNLYKSIENLIVTWSLDKNYDVIIDRPNLSPATRARYISLAKSCDCNEIVAVCFPILSPEESARRRFEADSRGYSYKDWVRAATEQFKSYQQPIKSEGFTKILHFYNPITQEDTKAIYEK